ncbi:DEAD/DEAH box helicase, partial [Mesotoga prima]|uniref:DEAD/DEAH box helicase n=1 Tax=Mesotoga prima TaxID=1184387 RepID=UPI002FDA12D7
FARYTGDTPEALPSNINRPSNMVRFTQEQLEEVRKGNLAPWEERLCREEIRENSPQIMLTNYSQLEYLLLRNKDLDIFRDSDLQFIVMDEVHSYVGELGSEVACLLRRLKLVVPNPENITFIGTSATVASRDEEPETVVKRFGSRLFGVEQEDIRLVTESYIELEREPDEYVPLFPRDPGEILKQMVFEVSQIPEEGEPGSEFYKLLTQLTYKTINKDNAYATLKKNVIISELQELFSKPTLLEEAVERIKALSGRKDASKDALAAEIYSYLLAGLVVKEDNEPLLRPKIHFFARGIQNLKVAFVDGQRQIILNDIDELQDHYYFSLYGCARCGQHYFVIPSASESQVEGVTLYTPVGMGDEPEESRMVLLTDVVTGDEQAYPSQNVWVCEKCGTVHDSPVQKCMNTLCGSDKLIQMKKVPTAARLRCLSCGVSLGKDDVDEERSSNLMPSVSNEALDILILAQNMLNSVSKDAAKLLVFTDNRQEAAFQAAFINQRSKRFRFRDYLYSVLEEGRAYTSDELAGEIAERIREQGEYRDFEVENSMRPDYFKDSVEWFLLEDFFMPRYRRGSLENLGLVKLTYGNVVSSKEFVNRWAEEFGAPVEEILATIENLLDHMRVNTGISHTLLGITNRDPRVARGYINLSKWFGPEVYILNAPAYNAQSNLKWWISNNGTSYYQRFMKKAFPENPDLADDFLTELWHFLVEERVLVERENSHFAINSEAIYFTKAPKRGDDNLPHLYECRKCGTRTFRKTPGLVCPRHNCDGKLTDVSVDTDDYNVKRHLSNREIRGLKAFEHSGQVRRPERER